MAYTIKNSYADSHIMDLNMMGLNSSTRIDFKKVELIAVAVPAVLSACAFVVVMTSAAMPELGFLAQCQNIPGGDICQITLQ